MKWKISLIFILALCLLTLTFSGCVEDEPVMSTQSIESRVVGAPTPISKPASIPVSNHQHIQQPLPTTNSTQAQGEYNLDLVTINLSGEGTFITPPFQLESGTYIFRMKNDGSSNFTVLLVNAKHVEWCGCYEYITAVPVDTLGTFDGIKAVKIPDFGDYVLDIDSEEGQWSIIIEKT